MNKKKIAMLIMVDGVICDEKYFEYSTPESEWTGSEDATDLALWFFY